MVTTARLSMSSLEAGGEPGLSHWFSSCTPVRHQRQRYSNNISYLPVQPAAYKDYRLSRGTEALKSVSNISPEIKQHVHMDTHTCRVFCQQVFSSAVTHSRFGCGLHNRNGAGFTGQTCFLSPDQHWPPQWKFIHWSHPFWSIDSSLRSQWINEHCTLYASSLHHYLKATTVSFLQLQIKNNSMEMV